MTPADLIRLLLDPAYLARVVRGWQEDSRRAMVARLTPGSTQSSKILASKKKASK